MQMEFSFSLPHLNGWEAVVTAGAVLLATLLAAVVLNRLFFRLAAGLARRTGHPLALFLVDRLRLPSRLLVPLLALILVLPALNLVAVAQARAEHLLTLVFIAALAWLATGVILAFRDYLLARYGNNGSDDYKARALETQLTVAVRVVVVIVVVVALAAMLMTFATIRSLGMSILASAGIVGVTVGFAAQRSIATLFAGLQVAITQPIRINDVVLVEGEYGNIEEITLTYVVVKIWDQRRLLVPVTYFLEKPFQNWTRRSSELLGIVFFQADFSLPVERVRQQLHEILLASKKWDGRVWSLQVTSATERSMELRALMSASDAPSVWDLRCEVREKLLDFMRDTFPESLPKARAYLSSDRTD
jgi:small-conductance mechanosensitive channel